MTLVDLVTELLDLANTSPPSAATIKVTLAGRDLTPAVHTVNLRDDPRGWGAYAELVVSTAARVHDLSPVLGELKPAPRSLGDSLSGDKLLAELPRGSTNVRVFIELAPRSKDRIAYVTLHFNVATPIT